MMQRSFDQKLKIKSVCCNADVKPDGESKTIRCSNCEKDLGHDPYDESKMIISKVYQV